VEEQAKPRESFMVDAYKVLKSLMKHLRRLIMHLGANEEHSKQTQSIAPIQGLLN
jgi:hypothetical protein